MENKINTNVFEVEIGNNGAGGYSNIVDNVDWNSDKTRAVIDSMSEDLHKRQAMFDEEQSAFKAGYNAYNSGLQTFDNPYNSVDNHKLNVLWNRGWWAACAGYGEINKPEPAPMNDPVSNYQLRMDVPIENLAAELFGVSGKGKKLEDHEIVEHATRKIRLLKSFMIGFGIKEGLLQAMMEE